MIELSHERFVNGPICTIHGSPVASHYSKIDHPSVRGVIYNPCISSRPHCHMASIDFLLSPSKERRRVLNLVMPPVHMAIYFDFEKETVQLISPKSSLHGRAVDHI